MGDNGWDSDRITLTLAALALLVFVIIPSL